jgi:hypothetical protein
VTRFCRAFCGTCEQYVAGRIQDVTRYRELASAPAALTQFGDVTVPADEESALEREIGAACRCVLRWAKKPCSNTANRTYPDGYCTECWDALDEPGKALPVQSW